MIGVRDTRRTRRVLIVLLAVALALIALNYSDSSSPVLRGVRHVSGSVFGGVEHAGSSVAGFFGASSGSSEQVGQLQSEVVRLRAELSAAGLSKTEYRQLHKMLQLAGTGRYRIVAATVIAVGQGYQQTVTLDVGSRDGVRAHETVLNGQGLVGQVTAVTAPTAPCCWPATPPQSWASRSRRAASSAGSPARARRRPVRAACSSSR